MKCPACPDTLLLMSDSMDIEIDYCPRCRGVWLDRGELVKLLDLMAAKAAHLPAVPRRLRRRHSSTPTPCAGTARRAKRAGT